MTLQSAYLVAARRTVLGRPGGIHRHRRIEDLAAPVIIEALKDAGLSQARVDRVVFGNTSSGGNPARLAALSAGVPESAPAMTIDQLCASGLEAVLSASRLIATGEARIVVAGGVEALSMAPWRVAKPKGVHQTPRFLPLISDEDGVVNEVGAIAAADRLAKRRKISRDAQDEYAFRAHLAASLARDARRFVKEVVALEATAAASRDESAVEPALEHLSALSPLRADGTLTSGNTSQLHEGAAAVVAVSQGVWEDLGKPPAMRLLLGVSIGVASAEEVEAPLVALRRLVGRHTGLAATDLDVVELCERSAVQAIVVRDGLALSDGVLNPDGGAIVRGFSLGAAGAVLTTRLFTRLARAKSADRARLGAVAIGASGGIGVAALFEAV